MGEAQDYLHIARILQAAGFDVELITAEKLKSNELKSQQYKETVIPKIIAASDIIIAGSYAPTNAILQAHKQAKVIILKLYEPSPVASLEFSDFKHMADRAVIQQYCTDALKLHLAVADMILYPSENAKYFYLGLLAGVGRLNHWQYAADRNYDHFLLPFSHGITIDSPRRKQEYYQKKYHNIQAGDNLVLWNGGIWNWYDPLTLIRAIVYAVRKNPSIKLIFQGYKHPDWPATPVGGQAISLSKKTGLFNKNIFFDDCWIPVRERSAYLSSVDLAVIFSQNILDSHFGARNRIFDHLWAGTPIIITANDSFATEIKDNGLGCVVKPQDHIGAGKTILSLFADKQILTAIGENIKRYRHNLTYGQSLKPLLAFCLRGQKAADWKKIPDRLLKILLKDFRFSEAKLFKLRNKHGKN